MRISPINAAYQRPVINAKRQGVQQRTSQPVAFNGIKNAVKGAGLLGLAGAVVGAICSGGASILATAAYFALCNAGVGAVAGATLKDDD